MTKYNVWRPIEDYFKEREDHDWALIQFKEKDTGFLLLPIIAECNMKGKWIPKEGEEDTALINYINDLCRPVAFMEWVPYRESFENKFDKDFFNDLLAEQQEG